MMAENRAIENRQADTQGEKKAEGFHLIYTPPPESEENAFRARLRKEMEADKKRERKVGQGLEKKEKEHGASVVELH